MSEPSDIGGKTVSERIKDQLIRCNYGDEVRGMTVNERLWHFGLFGAFDDAVATRDAAAIVAVLQQAKLTDAQARESASAILANLTR